MKIQNDGLFLIYGIILSLITITQRGLDVLISTSLKLAMTQLQRSVLNERDMVFSRTVSRSSAET